MLYRSRTALQLLKTIPNDPSPTHDDSTQTDKEVVEVSTANANEPAVTSPSKGANRQVLGPNNGASQPTGAKRELSEERKIKRESDTALDNSREEKGDVDTNATSQTLPSQASDHAPTPKRARQEPTFLTIEDDDDDDIRNVNSRPAHPSRRSATSPHSDTASGSQNPISATPPAPLTTAASSDRARKRDLAKLRLRELQHQQEQVKIERELLEMH